MKEPEFIERGNTFVVCFNSKVRQEKPKLNIVVTPRQKEIMSILSVHKELSASDINQQLTESKLSPTTLRDDLSKLKVMEVISNKGRGAYAVWFLNKMLK